MLYLSLDLEIKEQIIISYMDSLKRILITLFVGMMLQFPVLGQANTTKQVADTLRYKQNPNYDYELGLYKVYKKKRADLVMLGNSITHGVNWNELLGRDNVVERGIPADILQGMFARLNYVYDLQPRVVCIMGGINDIYNWAPTDEIFSNYKKIIDALREKKIKVIVQSTLYVAKRYQSSTDRNGEVEKLNKQLASYCKSNSIEFIDLNAKISKERFLRDEVTHDGLHLNANGYKIWGEELDKVLRRYFIY